jgi:hypothetical protein
LCANCPRWSCCRSQAHSTTSPLVSAERINNIAQHAQHTGREGGCGVWSQHKPPSDSTACVSAGKQAAAWRFTNGLQISEQPFQMSQQESEWHALTTTVSPPAPIKQPEQGAKSNRFGHGGQPTARGGQRYTLHIVNCKVCVITCLLQIGTTVITPVPIALAGPDVQLAYSWPN